jgi:hypothetical protein
VENSDINKLTIFNLLTLVGLGIIPIVFIFIISSLPGCVLLPSTTDKAVSAAQKYCAAVSADERALLRAQINGALQPADIGVAIRCPGQTWQDIIGPTSNP